MLRIERKVLFCAVLVVMAMSVSAFAGPQTLTVASFADPSIGSNEPLFIIDYGTRKITGEWLGSGLTLDVAITGNHYDDAVFVMDELVLSGGAALGGNYYANSGEFAPDGSILASAIHFYDEVDGIEVLTIEFAQIWVESRGSGLNAADAFLDDVVITGVGFGGITLDDERFSFSFANNAIEGQTVNATASFTSSAVPEPATMAILALGGLMLRRRK